MTKQKSQLPAQIEAGVGAAAAGAGEFAHRRLPGVIDRGRRAEKFVGVRSTTHPYITPAVKQKALRMANAGRMASVEHAAQSNRIAGAVIGGGLAADAGLRALKTHAHNKAINKRKDVTNAAIGGASGLAATHLVAGAAGRASHRVMGNARTKKTLGEFAREANKAAHLAQTADRFSRTSTRVGVAAAGAGLGVHLAHKHQEKQAMSKSIDQVFADARISKLEPETKSGFKTGAKIGGALGVAHGLAIGHALGANPAGLAIMAGATGLDHAVVGGGIGAGVGAIRAHGRQAGERKAFEESKHRRNRGRFASNGGVKKNIDVNEVFAKARSEQIEKGIPEFGAKLGEAASKFGAKIGDGATAIGSKAKIAAPKVKNWAVANPAKAMGAAAGVGAVGGYEAKKHVI